MPSRSLEIYVDGVASDGETKGSFIPLWTSGVKCPWKVKQVLFTHDTVLVADSAEKLNRLWSEIKK